MRSFRLAPLGLALAALLPAASARAELPPLIPREVLFGNPTRAAPRLSPDGKRLGYLRADDKGVLQIWVKTVGKDDDAPVTKEKTRGIRSYQWTWDSKRLLYGQDAGGDERFHVFAVDPTTKETRDLTPIVGVRAGVMAHEPDQPGVIVVSMNRRNEALFEPWKVDLETGATTLLAENPGDVLAWELDAELRVRGAEVAKPQGGGEFRVRDSEDAPWRTLATWSVEDEWGAYGFSKDGKSLYVSSNVGRDAAALLSVDVATGKETVIAAEEGVEMSEALVHPVTRQIQAVAFNRDRLRWKVLDPSIEGDVKALLELKDGDLRFSNRDLADTTWIVAHTSDVSPTVWHVWDRAAKKATFLFSSKPELEGHTLARMEFHEIPSRDGLSLPSYLTLPPGVEPKNLPLVLNVHGGPWARDSWGLDGESQLLANRGYAVLQVNYRGSGGFGKKFKNAAKREFAGKMHDDLIDAVSWAVKRGVADPKKVAIMGGSYGGYATLVGLTFTPDVFCCGVDTVGPSNLVSLVESFPAYWGPNLANNWYPFVGNPKDPKDRADMEARSPLFKVEKIKAPLLVGQGANDPRVTKKESDQMVDALRKLGREVEYVVYPDEGHGWARPANRMDWYTRVEAFLAKHLGGRAEPPAPTPAPAGAAAGAGATK
jgi:dipeptidyl aminopeptidase/acylaminoacyl peptidase